MIICAVSTAYAHTRSESFSHWHLSDTSVSGIVTIPVREVVLLYTDSNTSIPPQELFKAHLEATTVVSSVAAACERRASNSLQAASGFIRIELQFLCTDQAPDQIKFRAMFAAAPAHVHYAKLHRDGILLGEALITDAADTWTFDNLEAGISWSLLSFVKIGVQHIAGGIDHIAFLFGLLLIAGSIKRSVVAVTGFTLGHSISLAAAVLGYVRADSRLVEAFIGLTVALVAVEYFARGRQDARSIAMVTAIFACGVGVAGLAFGLLSFDALIAYFGFGVFAISYLLLVHVSSTAGSKRRGMLLLIMTGCFGVIHGFGFADFLMETGLLGTSLFVPLLGFNLGVELGQLMIVAAALSGVALFRKSMPEVWPQVLAAGLCAVGVFWFVERTIA